MSYAIVASSRTGNTRMLAKGLEEALAGSVSYFGGVPSDMGDIDGADAVLVGFWTDKGTCDDDLAAFLGRLSGKRVFLFGTAGFGGSEKYFSEITGRVAANLPADAELLGSCMCQGRMGEAVRSRFEGMLEKDPDDARAKAMIDNFDRALAHPDEADVERVVSAARSALGL